MERIDYEQQIVWSKTSENQPSESGRYWCVVSEINDLGESKYQWNCYYNKEDNSWSDKFEYMNVLYWVDFPKYPIE